MARILIIDDEELVRFTLRQMLERAGHEVHEARDGEEGLAQYREQRPDLVITDIIMPEKEGIETILELRRDGQDVKLIAISGGGRIGNLGVLETAKKLGADEAMAKPIERNQLLAMVQACIGSDAA